MKQMLFLVVAAGLFASCAHTYAPTTPAMAPMPEQQNQDPRKPSSTVTPSAIAQKYLEISDVMAQVVNNGQQCDFDISEYDVTGNFIKALTFARQANPNSVNASKVPASIQKAISKTLAYHRYMRAGEGEELVKSDFNGVELQVAAMTGMLRGTLALNADGTVTETKGAWDEKTEDFTTITTKGTWNFLPSASHKRKFPSLSVTLDKKSGKKTKVYTIVEDNRGDYYFVRGNIGRKLDYGDTPKYTDSDYLSVDWMTCGD